VILERRSQVSGSSPELSHHLTQVSGKFGQLFGSKNDQGHHEDDDQMGDTQHAVLHELRGSSLDGEQILRFLWVLKSRFCIIEEGHERVKPGSVARMLY
jgi:hypothetical protein